MHEALVALVWGCVVVLGAWASWASWVELRGADAGSCPICGRRLR